MKNQEIAARYALALFEVAVDKRSIDKVISELRAFAALLEKDEDFLPFFNSPIISDEDKEKALKKALTSSGVSEEVQSFLGLLAHRGRMNLFGDILVSFQDQCDKENKVDRGTVKSAAILSPEEREEIQDTISGHLGKRVILSYEEDPKLLGGLVATVGSYTFDDSLSTHFRRLKEDLKRRAH